MNKLFALTGYIMLHMSSLLLLALGVSIIYRASEAMKFPILIGGTFIVFGIFLSIITTIEVLDDTTNRKVHQ